VFNEPNGIMKAVLSVLFFPLLFQDAFVTFAWGSGEQFWIMIGKRVFLLLPVLSIILGCWATIACLPTVLIRQNRRQFLTGLLLTWWDLGKSIVSFWGGTINFLFNLTVGLLQLSKVLIFGIWSSIQEIIFTPFRMLRAVGQNVFGSPVPWIAVYMTFFWCFLEAFIFTYVTTPLVLDVFSNITGENLNLNFVRIPLFVFLLFVILGSYAVLATFVDSMKKKNLSTIIGVGAIEVVVLFVEVVFLYREFVDSLVPWFAQYSENFEPGILGILGISCFVWFGIRSLSWFLFASHGTPTILYMIQGKGVVILNRSEASKSRLESISPQFVQQIKSEMAWIKDKGDELMTAFMLPPLQIVAASINFWTLLLNSRHLFELPLQSMSNVTKTKVMLENMSAARTNLMSDETHEKPKEYENVQV